MAVEEPGVGGGEEADGDELPGWRYWVTRRRASGTGGARRGWCGTGTSRGGGSSARRSTGSRR